MLQVIKKKDKVSKSDTLVFIGDINAINRQQ
jgi:hypothetical protein